MPARFRSSPRDYFGAIWSTFGQVADSNLALIAAGVAFFSMLSLFPAIAAMIALLSLIANPDVVIAQLEEMRGLMPPDVYAIFNTQIVGLVRTSSDTLGWAGAVSVAVALWSARAGVGAMMNALDAVHGNPSRPGILHYLRALFLTLMLVAVGLVALLSVIVAPVVLGFLPLGVLGKWIAELVRWAIAVGVIFAGVGVLYRFGPNRERGFRMPWVTPGGTLAVLSWAGLSFGFSYYVANFGSYNEVYGSIGAVIAMLIWLWISSFLVLFGAVLNAQLELRQQAAATEPTVIADLADPGLDDADDSAALSSEISDADTGPDRDGA